MKRKSINILQSQRKSESDLRTTTRRFSITKLGQSQGIKFNKTTTISINNKIKSKAVNPHNKKASHTLKNEDNNTIISMKIEPNNFINDKTVLENFCNRSKKITSKRRLLSTGSKMSKKAQKTVQKTQKTAQEIIKEQNNQKIDVLLRNSNKIRKVFWNQAGNDLQPIIISADFILDQDDFWEKAEISPSIIKSWKSLHKYYFVIWIIKNQRSFIKMKQFINAYNLPVNSIYYCRSKRKYTTNYCTLVKQIHETYKNSKIQYLNILEVLKISQDGICDSSTFDGRIPIVSSTKAKICYVRVDGGAPGLDIAQIMLKQLKNPVKLNRLSSVNLFIENFYQATIKQQLQQNKMQNKLHNEVFNEYNLYGDQQQAENRVQRLKKSLIEQVINNKGRLFTYEGNSVYYFVGDIIKRNYNQLIQNAMLSSAKTDKKGTKRTDSSLQGCPQNRILQKTTTNNQNKELVNKKKISSLELPLYFYQFSHHK